MGGDALRLVLCRTGHASQTLVVHLRTQGLEEGDEHPHPMLSCGRSMVDFTFEGKMYAVSY